MSETHNRDESGRTRWTQLQLLQSPLSEAVLLPVEFSSDDAPASTAGEGVGHG